MVILDFANIVLEDVLEKRIAFSLAIHHVLDKQKMSLSDKKLVSALAGCSLRHYFLFTRIVDEHFPDAGKIQKYSLFNYMSNNLFVQKIDNKSMDKCLFGLLSETMNVKKEDFEKFKKAISDRKKLIPESINQTSVEYLSIRYNIPDWLIKLWIHHFGEDFTFKILRCFNRVPTIFCRLNGVSSEELLKRDKDFTAFNEDYVIYNGKESLKKHSEYLEYNVFHTQPIYKQIFDLIDVDELRGIAFYGGSSLSAPIIETICQLHRRISAEVILGNTETYFNTKHLCEKLKLNKFNLYEANPSQLITVLSKPVHTFIVVPENSRFDLIRRYPDYSIFLSQTDLDDFVNKQKDAIENCGEYVEENGYLVYMVPTLNHKEGHRIITNYLKNHKEYSLVKEKQFLPFDKYDSVLYYAVLKRGEIND